MFRNISLRTQLGVGFSVVAAVFLATLIAVAVMVGRLEDGVTRVSEESLPLMLAVDEMDLARSEVQQFLTDVSATHDPAAYEEAAEAATHFRAAAARFRQFLERSGEQDRLKQLTAIEASFEAFYASGKTMAETYLSQGLEAGNLLMKGSPGQPGFDQASEQVSEQLSKFRDLQLQQSQRDVESDRATTENIHHAMLWGGLVATLVAAAAAVLIVRAILGQFGAEPRVVAKFVQRIGTGNLSTQIRLRPDDEHSLMAHLHAMQNNLRDVVATVREKAQDVERASVEIESGSADLSGRTSGQAASLEETAASMEELNTRVRQNLDGARHAEQLAASASASAVQGGELVAQFVDTMQGINEASRKISEIIGVIDGIAFQTNILALNAAVEAARAGEQGRGFAVVASEVRTLAGRSAEAAKAIKGLIVDSVARVDDGSALVARTRSAMSTVVEGIREVSQAMGEITTASAEQSAGVAQVSESVRRMDQVTQQNAALVDASATSAVSLRRQAHALTEAVSVFTLAPAGAAVTAAAADSSGAGIALAGA